MGFIKTTIHVVSANSEAEIDQAAQEYAHAFRLLGTAFLARFLAKAKTKQGGGSTKPKPKTSTPPAPPKPPVKPKTPAPPPKPPVKPKTGRVPPKRKPFHKKSLDEKWYDSKTGDLKWPPDDGFAAGTKYNTTLKTGSVVDRYGGPTGTYTSPKGASYGSRALPYDKSQMPYKQYEVLRPVPVEAGKAAPWFGEAGGATQYKTGMTIQELLDAKPPFIKEI
jgi:Tuberculosis necrotizing toxin